MAVALSASLLAASAVLLVSRSPELSWLLASSPADNWTSTASVSGLETDGPADGIEDEVVAAAAVTDAAIAVAIVERNCEAATAATVAESQRDAEGPGGDDEDDEEEDDDDDDADVDASKDEDDDDGDTFAAVDCTRSRS